jgi:hypothetical protein
MSNKSILAKFSFSILLAIYCFALLRPLAPVIKDTIAHVFNELEHTATVHFEDGKYHLHSEVKHILDENKTSEKDEERNNELKKMEHHVAIDLEEVIAFEATISKNKLNSIQRNTLLEFHQNTSPPPQI